MSRKLTRHARQDGQDGQAMVEYLVAAGIVFGLFFLPFNGNPPLIVVFADAIQQGYARFFSAVALPI